MSKKDQGKAVKVILDTIEERISWHKKDYVYNNQDEMKIIVALLNSAFYVGAAWGLCELDEVKAVALDLDDRLVRSHSKYRIVFDKFDYVSIYKLMTFA